MHAAPLTNVQALESHVNDVDQAFVVNEDADGVRAWHGAASSLLHRQVLQDNAGDVNKMRARQRFADLNSDALAAAARVEARNARRALQHDLAGVVLARAEGWRLRLMSTESAGDRLERT